MKIFIKYLIVNLYPGEDYGDDVDCRGANSCHIGVIGDGSKNYIG